MTRHMKTETHEHRVLDWYECDLCHRKTKATHYYDVDQVKIEHRVGTDYPEGASGTMTYVDMCPDCWESRFLVWLKSQGVEPHTEEY